VSEYVLRKGSKYVSVLVLKKILSENPGYSYRNDGNYVFDEKLEVAVKALQKAEGLPENGVVDAATWAALGKTLTQEQIATLTSDKILFDLLNGVPVAPPGGSRLCLIAYGDPGNGTHNLGQLPEWAAKTHEKEVTNGAFAGVPSLSGATLRVVHVSTVSDLVKAINTGKVAYLAYFGHSWTQALYIGGANAPDTNLSNSGGLNDTKVWALPKSSFSDDAQIRLFGCAAGHGENPIAAQIAKHTGVVTYAYESPGGSLFTQDKELGHGKRRPTQADISFNSFKKTADTWLVPANGSRLFKKFP
jgi:peptidoglycan hydrolase-like protein with peptidoglycan-binding domain